MFQQSRASGYMQEIESWFRSASQTLSKAVFDYHTASPMPNGDEEELETTVADVKRAST